MSEFKGTKGNWKVKHLDDIFIENEFGEQICEMPATGIIKYETWRENAQLIAHAPQMIDMLEEVLDVWGEPYKNKHNGKSSPLYTKVKQLIQQATTI